MVPKALTRSHAVYLGDSTCREGTSFPNLHKYHKATCVSKMGFRDLASCFVPQRPHSLSTSTNLLGHMWTSSKLISSTPSSPDLSATFPGSPINLIISAPHFLLLRVLFIFAVPGKGKVGEGRYFCLFHSLLVFSNGYNQAYHVVKCLTHTE